MARTKTFTRKSSSGQTQNLVIPEIPMNPRRPITHLPSKNPGTPDSVSNQEVRRSDFNRIDKARKLGKTPEAASKTTGPKAPQKIKRDSSTHVTRKPQAPFVFYWTCGVRRFLRFSSLIPRYGEVSPLATHRSGIQTIHKSHKSFNKDCAIHQETTSTKSNYETFNPLPLKGYSARIYKNRSGKRRPVNESMEKARPFSSQP